jgi:hypothetical protein
MRCTRCQKVTADGVVYAKEFMFPWRAGGERCWGRVNGLRGPELAGIEA